VSKRHYANIVVAIILQFVLFGSAYAENFKATARTVIQARASITQTQVIDHQDQATITESSTTPEDMTEGDSTIETAYQAAGTPNSALSISVSGGELKNEDEAISFDDLGVFEFSVLSDLSASGNQSDDLYDDVYFVSTGYQ
jgi:hypothetical protein